MATVIGWVVMIWMITYLAYLWIGDDLNDDE